MQDGNWNVVAICDVTGTVGERYAYSAYGSPVFMNGAGTVQASSPIGFETLYAGYRWDNAAPQMYYVRNRFLLPAVDTWNRKDLLGMCTALACINPCFQIPLCELPRWVSLGTLKRAGVLMEVRLFTGFSGVPSGVIRCGGLAGFGSGWFCVTFAELFREQSIVLVGLMAA